MRVLIAVCILAVFFASCQDYDQIVEPPSIQEQSLFLLNEGNFGWGEGTLSIYNPTSQQLDHEVFKTLNNENFGNVLQSVSKINNRYYFTVNNSQKIIITNDSLFKVGEVTGLTSPRYIYPVSNNKAYITDLYAEGVYVLNLTTNEIDKRIDFNGWSERGVLYKDLFWVTAPETEYIYAIDVSQDQVVDSIDVGFFNESVVLDNSAHLWVLARGDESSNNSGQLTEVDADTRAVLERKKLDDKPQNLVYNASNNHLYYINNGINSLPAQTKEIPYTLYTANGSNFYAIAVDTSNNEVYVSDVHDFTQRSTISRVSENGELLNEFKAGIICGNLFFDY